MKIKQQRWYEVKGDLVYIYDTGYAKYSTSVSLISKSDLPYYRNSFKLEKVWEDEENPETLAVVVI